MLKHSLMQMLIIRLVVSVVIGLAGLLILVWQDGWIALGVVLLLWGDNLTRGR